MLKINADKEWIKASVTKSDHPYDGRWYLSLIAVLIPHVCCGICSPPTPHIHTNTEIDVIKIFKTKTFLNTCHKVYKVLAAQAWGPEFILQNSCEKAGHSSTHLQS